MTRLLLLFLCLNAALAGADERVVESHPAAGATLPGPLKDLHIVFDQPPQDPQVTIVGPAQADINIQGLHGMGSYDLMGRVVGTMPDGDYELRWQLGDPQAGGTSGVVPFTIARSSDFVEDRWEPPLDIGIVLYDGAEPLDVFGPLEMWMNAGPELIRVHLIAEEKRLISLTTTSYPRALAPRLQAQYSFEDAPELDVLMVPGGIGTLVEVENEAMIGFLQRTVPQVTLATSVCTGSALYARAGLLEGVEATGNKVFFDYLTQQGPAEWREEARWVESGRFFTSSGVSAGMDMSLAVIARFFGLTSARMIAASAEYEWQEDASYDPFVRYLNSAVPYVDMLKARFEAE